MVNVSSMNIQIVYNVDIVVQVVAYNGKIVREF